MCLLHVKVAKSDTQVNGSVGWTKKRQTEVLVGQKRDKAGSLRTRLQLRRHFKCFESIPNERDLFLAAGDCSAS